MRFGTSSTIPPPPVSTAAASRTARRSHRNSGHAGRRRAPAAPGCQRTVPQLPGHAGPHSRPPPAARASRPGPPPGPDRLGSLFGFALVRHGGAGRPARTAARAVAAYRPARERAAGRALLPAHYPPSSPSLPTSLHLATTSFRTRVGATVGGATKARRRAQPVAPRPGLDGSTCANARAHACTHARTHAHLRTHARTHAHAHARTHARTHSRTHARTHIRRAPHKRPISAHGSRRRRSSSADAIRRRGFRRPQACPGEFSTDSFRPTFFWGWPLARRRAHCPAIRAVLCWAGVWV